MLTLIHSRGLTFIEGRLYVVDWAGSNDAEEIWYKNGNNLVLQKQRLENLGSHDPGFIFMTPPAHT